MDLEEMKELLQQYKREKSQALSALKAWNKYRKTITDPAEKEAAKQKASSPCPVSMAKPNLESTLPVFTAS